MAYEVLARKWRPKQFEDVVGQAHVTRTLANAIESGRIAHAYLFIGPRGIGKTSLSRIFAKALNCEKGPTIHPCDTCDVCREITSGSALDVQEIDGASNNKVEDVHSVLDQVAFQPARARFKIFIIDEVHMLTSAAFNALLKTLEEPPPHVKFIFATTEGDKVLPTIISRCQRFDLRRIQTGMIVERLRLICEAEGVTVSDDALLAVARGAEGGMRDALSALDQLISFKGTTLDEEDVLAVFGLVARKSLEDLAGAILDGDIPRILELISFFDSAGKDMRRLVGELMEYFRNLLVSQQLGEDAARFDVTVDQISAFKAQAQKASAERILQITDQLTEAEGRLRYSLSVRTLLEMTLIRCARIARATTLDEVLRRLAALRDAPPPVSLHSGVLPSPNTPETYPKDPAALDAKTRAEVYTSPIVKEAVTLFNGDVVGVEN